MADRVVLHIGTMKSGTTYLQRLLESGVLESGGGFFAGGSYRAQSRAVDRLPRWSDRRAPHAWQEIADRVKRRDGVAVYSHEFLSFAREDRVARIVGSFGGAPVDVVLTVRDRATAIPAQWQTYVRNRGTDSWADYLQRLESACVRGRGRPQPRHDLAVRTFLRAQDVPTIIARWRRPPEVASVAVVVVPLPGAPPDLLWRRFRDAAGLEVPTPPGSDSLQNPSLGYASCDLLRRLNPALAGLSRTEHERARRPVVSTLLPLRAEEARPVLDGAGRALARRLNRRILRATGRHGVRLVGSPDDLPVADDGDAPPSVPAPDPDQLRRAFVTAWEHCVPGVPAPADLDQGVCDLGRRLATRFGP